MNHPFSSKLITDQYKIPIVIAVIYCVIGLLTFINGLHGPFMMDDYSFFDNRKANIKNLAQQFIPDSDQSLYVGGQKENFYYRPLQHALLMIAFHFFHANTFGFHCLNLLFHIFTAWMFYWFFRRVFDNHQVGFIAGLLFIVHPINGIVVNYITATVFTAQSLCIIFCLFFLWKSQIIECRAKKNFLIFLSTLFFIAGLLFHETALATPFYAAALMWIVLEKRGKEFIISVLPLFIIASIYFLIRLKISSLATTILNTEQTHHLNPIVFLASFSKIICWYLGKLIYPSGILFIWTTPFTRGIENILWILIFLGLIGIMGGLLYSFRKSKAILLGLTWLIIGFLPVSVASLFPGQALMMEPHWMVFASIGFFLFISEIFSTLSPNFNNRIINPGLVILIISLMIVSLRYNYYWADEKRYCRYWLEELPQHRTAQFFLAQRLLKDGNYLMAEPYYYQLLNGSHVDALMYSNLGVINIYKKDFEKAKRHLLKAQSIDPNIDVVNNSLGIIAAQEGQDREAQKYFEKAIEINKYEIVARINLARLCLKEKRLRRAAELLTEILSINPNNEEAMIGLWEIYLSVQNNEKLKILGKYIQRRSTNNQFKNYIRNYLSK